MSPKKFRCWFNGEMIYDYFSLRSDGVPSMYSNKNIIPPIIMQFTGLYDKNGKEIYEGDIILRDQVVTWNDETEDRGDNELHCWGIQNGKYDLNSYSKHDDFIVIGNIYENPEIKTRNNWGRQNDTN